MLGKKWTEKEINYLKNNYGKIDNKIIAEKLGRPRRAIQLRAFRLALGPSFRAKKKSELISKIRLFPTKNKTSYEICKALNISRDLFYRLSGSYHIPYKRGALGKKGHFKNCAISGFPSSIILDKRYDEKRRSVHHIDGNPENNNNNNLIEIPQGLHFVVHQVAKLRTDIKLPSFFFIGKMGSGKTTHADFLVSNYGFKKFSFAKKVKEIARNHFGEENRILLQTIGKVGRALDPFLWIKYLMRELTGYCVVDDCRFLNEFLTLKLLGFTSVYLECDPEIRLARAKDVAGVDDISETELETLRPFSDYVLDTNKPIKINNEILAQIFMEKKNEKNN